jgi:hypothetical protein
MRMIFEAIGGMKFGRGNRSTRRKPTPAPLCPPPNPTWQTRSRTPDRSGGKPATNRLSYGASGHSPYITSSLTRGWVYLLWICLSFLQMHVSHIQHVIENRVIWYRRGFHGNDIPTNRQTLPSLDWLCTELSVFLSSDPCSNNSRCVAGSFGLLPFVRWLHSFQGFFSGFFFYRTWRHTCREKHRINNSSYSLFLFKSCFCYWFLKNVWSFCVAFLLCPSVQAGYDPFSPFSFIPSH